MIFLYEETTFFRTKYRPDPFRGGAYNLQLMNDTSRKVIWFMRLHLNLGWVLNCIKRSDLPLQKFKTKPLYHMYDMSGFFVAQSSSDDACRQ